MSSKSIISIVAILNFWVSFSINAEYLELAESKLFYPQKQGISSARFKFKIMGIEKYIKETTAIEKVKEIYFDVVWQAPGKISTKVIGIDPKYSTLVSSLEQQANQRLYKIFQQPITSLLRSYKVHETKNKNELKIDATDETFTRDINSMQFTLEESGRIRESIINYPSSQIKTMFQSSAKGWSQGKFVLDELNIHTRTMNSEYFEKIKYNYIVIGGVGFPEKIQVDVLSGDEKYSKKIETLGHEELYFWDYQLNTTIRY